MTTNHFISESHFYKKLPFSHLILLCILENYTMSLRHRTLRGASNSFFSTKYVNPSQMCGGEKFGHHLVSQGRRINTPTSSTVYTTESYINIKKNESLLL